MLLVYRNTTSPSPLPDNDPRRRAAWKLAVSLVPVFIVLFFFLALCIWWIARLDSVYVQDFAHSLQQTRDGVRSAWDALRAAPSSCFRRLRGQAGRPDTSSYAPVEDGAAEPLVRQNPEAVEREMGEAGEAGHASGMPAAAHRASASR